MSNTRKIVRAIKNSSFEMPFARAATPLKPKNPATTEIRKKRIASFSMRIPLRLRTNYLGVSAKHDARAMNVTVFDKRERWLFDNQGPAVEVEYW